MEIDGVFGIKAGGGHVRGIPDRVYCCNGLFVALEFKKSKKEAEKQTGRAALQRRILMRITQAGGYAAFIYPENKERVLNDIRKIAAKK